MYNSRKAIIYQMEVNVYYRNHVERMRIDVCDLGKTNIILGILQLQTHNPEINWEVGEVKMTKCLPMCDRRDQRKRRKSKKKKEQQLWRKRKSSDGQQMIRKTGEKRKK